MTWQLKSKHAPKPPADWERELDSCFNCMNFYDRHYCKKWQDIVPEEVRPVGCDERDQYPPF